MIINRSTTKYPASIKDPASTKNVLKPGSNNAKLGFRVTSRKWKGKHMYSLTLVERETCPRSCHHWNDCYGNHMPFAHRFSIEGLLPKLESEIETLTRKHKAGIVIRLHVLGDFYSVDYVKFWERMLIAFPTLSIFGYTANPLSEKIGEEIGYLNAMYKDRCTIRFSRNEPAYWPNAPSAANESFEGKSFTCPEQIGLAPSCAACGACWSIPTTVRFLTH